MVRANGPASGRGRATVPSPPTFCADVVVTSEISSRECRPCSAANGDYRFLFSLSGTSTNVPIRTSVSLTFFAFS